MLKRLSTVDNTLHNILSGYIDGVELGSLHKIFPLLANGRNYPVPPISLAGGGGGGVSW